MLRGLEESIFKSGLLGYIRILFLAGDVFDRLLSLDDPNIHHIDVFISKLLRACKDHGVMLRVMEGTPSHDRRQSKRFETIEEMINTGVDLAYVTETSIEYIEALKTHVLYVPDEAHPTTIQTKEVVQALLDARGIKQVDLCIMHGYFQYQLPYVTKEGSYHDIDFYQSITKHWISIGHVHTRSRFGKVLAQGSHDRCGHGEEGEKGYVVATIGNPKDDAYFIDNPHATVFKSVETYDMLVEDAVKLLHEEASKLLPGARLRIVAEPEDPIFDYAVTLQLAYPNIVVSKKPKSRGEQTIAEKILDNVIGRWQPIRIDENNIVEMVVQRLQKQNASHDINRLTKRLQECL